MECEIFDLDLADPDWPAPYLSIDKCDDLLWQAYADDPRPCRDNGRILRAKHVKIYITDIDLRIILREYRGHIIFNRCYYAAYGNLPRRFINVINSYYTAKTQLKGLPDPDGSIGVMYRQAKAKNNGIYGMEATDPIKPELIYNGETIDMPLLDDATVGRLYDEYTKKAWIPYSWGVWTTALARYELHRGMWAISDDPSGAGCWDLVYWDTDSLKYVGDHDEALRKLNLSYIKRSRSNKGFASDPSGEEHFLGVFEKEETYKRFITWGAKKYAYEYEDGEPHVTIAGVNKEIGAEELKEKGGLDALKAGFKFKKAGGTESVYNDTVPAEYQNMNIDGHWLHITKNIALLPSTYSMGITFDYSQLLKEEKLWRAMLDDDVIYRYTKRRSVKS